MKRETKILDGTPSKRSLWPSLMTTNFTRRFLDEIDNALDLYVKGPQLEPVYKG